MGGTGAAAAEAAAPPVTRAGRLFAGTSASAGPAPGSAGPAPGPERPDSRAPRPRRRNGRTPPDWSDQKTLGHIFPCPQQNPPPVGSRRHRQIKDFLVERHGRSDHAVATGRGQQRTKPNLIVFSRPPRPRLSSGSGLPVLAPCRSPRRSGRPVVRVAGGATGGLRRTGVARNLSGVLVQRSLPSAEPAAVTNAFALPSELCPGSAAPAPGPEKPDPRAPRRRVRPPRCPSRRRLACDAAGGLRRTGVTCQKPFGAAGPVVLALHTAHLGRFPDARQRRAGV